MLQVSVVLKRQFASHYVSMLGTKAVCTKFLIDRV